MSAVRRDADGAQQRKKTISGNALQCPGNIMPNKYLILFAASIVALVASFIAFIIMIVSGDLFAYDASVADIMITIFVYLGVVMLCMLLMLYSLIKYGKSKSHSAQQDLTTKCISCGATIGITELSCPRCFTLQPPGGRSPSLFRKH